MRWMRRGREREKEREVSDFLDTPKKESETCPGARLEHSGHVLCELDRKYFDGRSSCFFLFHLLHHARRK